MRGILVFFLTHTEKTGDPRHHLKLLVSVTPIGPHSQLVHTASSLGFSIYSTSRFFQKGSGHETNIDLVLKCSCFMKVNVV